MGYKVVVMGDFNAHIARGDEAQNMRLLNLRSIYRGTLIANEPSVCKGRWT